MKFTLHIVFSWLGLFLSVHSEIEDDNDHDPMPVVVYNGTGDGTYGGRDIVTITAEPTLNGSQFLAWITIRGPSGCIDNPTSSTTSLRTSSNPTTVAAIYGDAKLWYPNMSEPAYNPVEPIVGLFLPRVPGGEPTPRRKLKLKVKIEAAELGVGHEVMIFKALAFTLKWWPVDEGVWHSRAVEFYTQEAGGRQLSINDRLSLTGKHDITYEIDQYNPGIRSITIWYEPKWSLADLVATTTHPAPRPAPKMLVSATLNRVFGDSQTGGAYSPVKQLSSTIVPVMPTQVRFGGTSYHELKSDSEAITYNRPQWEDVDGDAVAITNIGSGEKNYAVAYTKKKKPLIGARFKIEGFSSNEHLQVRATSPQGITIPTANLVHYADGVFLMPLSISSSEFVDTVEFYDLKDDTAFQLNWEIKYAQDGNDRWTKFASTKHTVCITNADPTPDNPNVFPPRVLSKQETLFVTACKNAKGKTSNNEILDGIWNAFKTKEVQTYDNRRMYYYLKFTCTTNNTIDLIKTGDGQCGAWCHFLVDLLKVHGIDNTNEVVQIKPKIRGGLRGGFIVKNWLFIGTGTSNDHSEPLPFPFKNVPATNPVEDTGYNWESAEVVDQAGKDAQGKSLDPASLFDNHFIVSIGGRYYDPSYGVDFDDLQILDNEMAGYYRSLPYAVLFQNNPPGCTLEATEPLINY